jgi:hypothetical protein
MGGFVPKNCAEIWLSVVVTGEDAKVPRTLFRDKEESSANGSEDVVELGPNMTSKDSRFSKFFKRKLLPFISRPIVRALLPAT